jgi:hypothetical protein
VNIDSVPSYDVMENLCFFAADFYTVVSRAFIGSGPDDLRTNRPVQVALVNLLKQLGIADVRTDWV